MQANIYLNEIVETYQLDLNRVSKILFPDNKHPKLAFKRVLIGDASLNAKQMLLLAKYIGVSVDDLYGGWKHTALEDNLHEFTTKEYVAKLNLETGVTQVFIKGTSICETLLHSNTLTFSEYFAKLNSITKKLKQ